MRRLSRLLLVPSLLLAAPALGMEEGTTTFVKSGTATLAVRDHGSWNEIEVVAVEGNPQSVTLSTGSRPGAWALPLDYRTRVQALPGAGDLLATAYARTGIVGAKVAIIPSQPELRRALQEVVVTSELWRNRYGGPWALDHGPNYGSYMMTVPECITRENVDAWIRLSKLTGVTQIDWVHCIRYGDYVPRPELYPAGWEDVRFLVARLHSAGVLSLLHTYSLAIDPRAAMYTDSRTKPGPDGYRLPTDAKLVDDVAGRLAAAIDSGGFDGVYFDALDWAAQIEGREWGWYWAGRFVHECGARLRNRDLIVESAMFGASIWQVTSRYGSLDYKGADWRGFVDGHIAALRPAYLLPSTMGWMPIDGTRNIDDLAYLATRAREAHAGVSWRNLTPTAYSRGGWTRQAAGELRRLWSGSSR